MRMQIEKYLNETREKAVEQLKKNTRSVAWLRLNDEARGIITDKNHMLELEHYFNEDGDELAYYHTIMDCFCFFAVPRKWSEEVKKSYTFVPYLYQYECNGYTINYNTLFHEYGVSHALIGVCEFFNTLGEAMEYCNNG